MSTDVVQVLARARELLLRPRSAWPRIAAEVVTQESLYRDYIAFVAAVAPLAAFIKGSLLGVPTAYGVSLRIGWVPGLVALIVNYLLLLVAVYVLALAIAALAPGFEGRRNRLAALKLAGYGSTPALLGAAAVLLPALGTPVHVACLVYGIHVLRLGLPVLLGVPRDRTLALAALCALMQLVLGFAAARIAALLTGPLYPLAG
jgi:Yip1 domain